VTLGITGIIAAYILLAVLLLSINLYSKWPWQLKAGAIVITSAFYVITYFSFPALLGWPTTQDPPTQFRLLAAHVEQPDKEKNTTGIIYLWLSKINNMTDLSDPRAYEFDYSPELHEKIINVNAKLDNNIAQIGEFKEPDDAFAEVTEQKRGVKSIKIEFYDLPDPLFPDK
tara:strand:+ start:208 stop:720 length:513 start_codon:yes stop_codon:yes gene_type:complete